MRPVRVYRSGGLRAPRSHGKILQELIDHVDRFKPTGRQGRMGALFGNLNFESSVRWIGFSSESELGIFSPVYELQVDPRGVYHYEIRRWDRIDEIYGSSSYSSRDYEQLMEAYARSYWESGVELCPDHDSEEDLSFDRELLLSPASILSVRRLSNGELMERRYWGEPWSSKVKYSQELAQRQKSLDDNYDGALPATLIGEDEARSLEAMDYAQAVA